MLSSAEKLEPYLHSVALWAILGAHPLLSIFAENPAFLLARGWGTPQIVAFAITLVFAVPLPWMLLRGLVARRSEPGARGLDVALVFFAAAAFVLQLLRTSLAILYDGHPAVLCGIAAGVAAAVLYRRFPTARSFVTFLAPAPVAVVLVFLLDPRVPVGTGADLEPPPDLRIEAPPPIVFVLLDALSSSALLDGEQRVNVHRYPELAALAADGFFFPHASAVSCNTVEAVPGILTGRFPGPEKLPRLADYPRNLFTLLGGRYRIVAGEEQVRLCPPSLNEGLSHGSPPFERWRLLAGDLALVFLHRTLPESYGRRLPRVDQNWGGFLQAGAGEVERFHDFLEVLDGDRPPSLYYLHLVYPHTPFLYLPNGKFYLPKLYRRGTEPLVEPVVADGRPPDLEMQIFLYKKYLFQVGYLDRLMGELVARLREVGLYDRALIVVTADHGGRTRPEGFEGDVYSVPLFVKPPAGLRTEVFRPRVGTLDILPSLLDLLGAVPPWEMEGRSFFAESYQPPGRFYRDGELEDVSETFVDESDGLVTWKLRYFGTGEDPRSLFRAGSPRPDLLDRRLGAFELLDGSGVRVELDGGPVDYDPAAAFAPVLLTGWLRLDEDRPECCVLAVSVNDRIEATATARRSGSSRRYRFWVTVPESAYRPGRNDVRAWIVEPGEPPRLVGGFAAVARSS